MAVDTRDKRASCLGIAGTPAFVAHNPDGSFSQADRQQAAYAYRGILAGGAAEETSVSPFVPVIDED